MFPVTVLQCREPHYFDLTRYIGTTVLLEIMVRGDIMETWYRSRIQWKKRDISCGTSRLIGENKPGLVHG